MQIFCKYQISCNPNFVLLTSWTKSCVKLTKEKSKLIIFDFLSSQDYFIKTSIIFFNYHKMFFHHKLLILYFDKIRCTSNWKKTSQVEDFSEILKLPKHIWIYLNHSAENHVHSPEKILNCIFANGFKVRYLTGKSKILKFRRQTPGTWIFQCKQNIFDF